MGPHWQRGPHIASAGREAKVEVTPLVKETVKLTRIRMFRSVWSCVRSTIPRILSSISGVRRWTGHAYELFPCIHVVSSGVRPDVDKFLTETINQPITVIILDGR